MATSKLLKPTNVTISIPAFTDQPDQRVNSNCIDKEADAINSLSEQIVNCPSVITGSLSNTLFNAGEGIISVNAPSGMPNKDAIFIAVYTEYNKIFFTWIPDGTRNLQNNNTWNFAYNNLRGASVSGSLFYCVYYQ